MGKQCAGKGEAAELANTDSSVRLSFSKSWVQKGWSLAHRHDTAEVIRILAGRFHLQCGNISWQVNAGQVAFLAPNVFHHWKAEVSVHYAAVMFDGSGNRLYSPSLNHLLRGKAVALEQIRPLVTHELDWFFTQLQSVSQLPPSRPKGIYVEACLAAYLALFYQNWSIDPRLPGDGPGKEAVLASLSSIHDHLATPIKVSDLAQHAALSENHYRKLFKAYLGVSPKQYIINARLEAAKALLLDRQRTVTEIALETGLASVSHFYRVFRQREGRSPSEWRGDVT